MTRQLLYREEELERKIKDIRRAVFRLELARFTLYKELADIESRMDYEFVPIKQTLPPCEVAIYEDSEHGDVLHISYPGMLPRYDTNNREGKELRQEVRHYYVHATRDAIKRERIDIRFEQSYVVIIHCFADLRVRDLDNRNRKYLIDALRVTRLIGSDSWMNTVFTELGAYTKKNNSVELFIGNTENMHGVIDIAMSKVREKGAKLMSKTEDFREGIFDKNV